MRAFLAFSLPDNVRLALEELQQELAQSGADVKWVEPANLHVTLKFLDEITEEQARGVQELLERLGRATPAFRLGLGRPGAFPSLTAPRVVWVALSEGHELVAGLAGRIEVAGNALGLRKEERPFSPHLTIGRVRSPRGHVRLAEQLQATAWQPPAAWPVTSMTLYQSALSSQGPTYTVVAEISLAAR